MRHLLLGNHGPFAFGFALRAAVWTPAQLPQVQAWWDASDESTITLNANRVAAIADKSLNAYTLTQPTAADQPIYDTSGSVASLPMLQQDSVDALNSTTTSLLRNTGDAYIFTVGYYPTTADSSANYMLVFVSSGLSSASTRMGLTAYPTGGSNALSIGGRRLDSDTYDVVTSSTTRASIENTLFLETSRRHYAQNKTYHWTNGNIDLNGVAFPNQTAGNTSDTDPLLVSLLAPSATLPTLPDTRIGEVIICNQTLSEEDRQRVEGYLAWKWGGDALWTPAQLTNLAMWLDAADESTITLNGSTVAQWNDKSGNGRNATQATATNQPTYTTNALNGLPVITFDGLNDGFALSGTSAPVPRDAFNVSQGYGYLYSNADPANDSRIAHTNTNLLYWSTAGNSPAGTATPLRNVNDVLIEHYAGQNTALNEIYINGSFSRSFTTVSAWVDDNQFDQIGLPWGSPTSLPSWRGIISEVIFTNSLLSVADRQRVEGYLAHKWGLVADLPASHPYKYQAPRL